MSINKGVIFLKKKSMEPPFTNRGVTNTLKVAKNLEIKGNFNNLKQFILIDWFQATILYENFDYDSSTGEFFGYFDFRAIALKVFNYLFNIDKDSLVFEYKGINGYNCCYSYDNIYLYYHSNRPEMGIHIKMSGQGCRDFEALGLDYIDLFHKLNNYIVNYNRIDISIDDFTNNYFDLNKLFYYVKKGSLVSKFHSVLRLQKISLSDIKDLGNTLQFGSKASNVQVTFYDKLKERISQDFIVDSDIKFWFRTEVRFRHDVAKSLVYAIIENSANINYVVKGVLSDYISFRSLNSNDSNISRRKVASFWLKFLENIDSLKLSNYLPENSIVKKERWLLESTSKSNLMVVLSKLDNLKVDDHTVDYLLKLLKFGFDKFNFKDLQLVNSSRISNNLDPLNYFEVLDYLNDINEFLSISNKELK